MINAEKKLCKNGTAMDMSVSMGKSQKREVVTVFHFHMDLQTLL